MSDYPVKPITKHALSNPAVKLYAKNTQDKWATLQFASVCQGRKKNDNVFEILVWTNVDSDTDKSIKAQLDVITFSAFLNNLKLVIDSKPALGEKFITPVLELHDDRWVQDQQTGKRKTDGTFATAKIYLGKDEQGQCFISLVSTKQGRPVIKFIFHLNKLSTLVKQDGNVLTPAEHSCYAAQAFLQTFQHLHFTTLANNFILPESSENSAPSKPVNNSAAEADLFM